MISGVLRHGTDLNGGLSRIDYHQRRRNACEMLSAIRGTWHAHTPVQLLSTRKQNKMNVINRGWIKARTWALKAAWWLAGYHIAAPKGKIVSVWLPAGDEIIVTVMTPVGIVRVPLTVNQTKNVIANLRLLVDVAQPKEAMERIQRELRSTASPLSYDQMNGRGSRN